MEMVEVVLKAMEAKAMRVKVQVIHELALLHPWIEVALVPVTTGNQV